MHFFPLFISIFLRSLLSSHVMQENSKHSGAQNVQKPNLESRMTVTTEFVSRTAAFCLNDVAE